MQVADHFSNISLFTGAMGLDLGLTRAGFETRVAVEMDRFAVQTIQLNRPQIPVLSSDIRRLSTKKILDAAKLSPGQPDIVSGGPACQAFSTVGKRASLQDPRGRLVDEFIRVVREARPRFFLMENVMGILSAAVKHRPIKERGKGFPPLTEDEKRGSALGQILQKIDDTGYTVSYWHLNAADFGVPQVRHRVFFIGCRDRIELDPPVPTHDKRGGVTLPWINLREVIQDLFEKDRRGLAFSPRTRHYLKKIPAGCNWKALPRRSWKRAIRGAYDSSGGRTGFLRRLSWDTPAPTLVAYPLARATCMCHPEENRPLSIREYARIQQFPDDWIFAGGLGRQYKMIGNAVPVGLAQAVGEAIASKLRQHLNQDSELKGMPEPVFQHVRV